MLDRLAGRSHFCFLDGYSGYNQIFIAPEDREKTSFTCLYGIFAFQRMLFGLCNAPATFQRCMIAIFTDMVEDIMKVFMDDFSVVGYSFEDCLHNLRRVLKRKNISTIKEQLLGSVDINAVGESLDPEVKILSLEIKSPGRSDIVLPIPADGNPKSPWFVLKEGSKYSLKFTFQVSNNIVTGLKYTNTVWKTGIKVDSTKQMIGAFSPQLEPYTHEMPEDTTPSGIFARGSYSARTKFLDDDNKCYLEINYTFEIKKDWQEK
ncbi:rho GDP-dissociation inhibitor 1-like [Nicotiana tomentosiformis]|uniref:rho GDP-dissociation inhibitor 1-like n=1 Tax=Nicotiana tomentosiformis TaxID=4098 RepID=UPI00388CD43C